MNKRGSVLAYVLVVIVVLYTIAVFALRASFSAKMLQIKGRDKALAAGYLESARSQVVACLQQNNFPVASCTTEIPPAACLPANIGTPPAAVSVSISGDNYPVDHYCKLSITVTLP